MNHHANHDSEGYRPEVVPYALKMINKQMRNEPEVASMTEQNALSKRTDDADICGYCNLRFPVADLRRSIDFYCNVLGYVLDNPEQTNFSFGEAFIRLKNGNGPGIFLMETGEEDVTPLKFTFPRPFWATNEQQQLMVVEMLTNNLNALHDRLKQAGARIEKEPVFTETFGYLTFYDPDGHYIQAVEERGEYFNLQQRIRSKLNRELTDHENQLLWGLCAAASTEQQKFLNSLLSK